MHHHMYRLQLSSRGLKSRATFVTPFILTRALASQGHSRNRRVAYSIQRQPSSMSDCVSSLLSTAAASHGQQQTDGHGWSCRGAICRESSWPKTAAAPLSVRSSPVRPAPCRVAPHHVVSVTVRTTWPRASSRRRASIGCLTLAAACCCSRLCAAETKGARWRPSSRWRRRCRR